MSWNSIRHNVVITTNKVTCLVYLRRKYVMVSICEDMCKSTYRASTAPIQALTKPREPVSHFTFHPVMDSVWKFCIELYIV